MVEPTIKTDADTWLGEEMTGTENETDAETDEVTEDVNTEETVEVVQ